MVKKNKGDACFLHKLCYYLTPFPDEEVREAVEK